MKSNHPSILLFGHAEELLAPRKWVLESRGYRVLAATSLADIAALPRTQSVALVLFCHTLTPGERAGAIALSRARWPEVKLHALTEASRAPSGILGRLMHTCEGPSHLVATVTALLGDQALAPRKSGGHAA